ncbi:MAG TPA: nitroreductase family protein [Candidatus Methanoperedens sp.]|nr:nitroreductase family protein [Candidatus Methanoperedens sp.]
MTRFIVDESKCRRDGICAAVCPVGIIIPGGTSPPALAPGGEELCIACGHCVAACPYGACSLDTMATETCPPVRPEWQLSPEQAEHFLRSRRSIRVYKEAAVDQGRLERLIRVARYAPSGHNTQPVRWLVVSGHEAVRGLAGHVVDWMRMLLQRKPELARRMRLDRLVTAWDAGKDPVCRGAPHLVVAHAPADDVTAPSAGTLALAYLELAAPSFGLGACWAGYLHMAAPHWPPLRAALALPEKHQLGGAMVVGEPRYRYHRFPLRKEPEIVWR